MARRPSGVIKLFSAILAVLAFTVGPAGAASKIAKLTEENVTAFINKTTEITAGGVTDMSPEEIAAYLEGHIEKKARFKSTMKYNIPGYPPQETSMSLEKKDFIESVKKGAEEISDYDSEIQIESIKISSKGDKATVGTTSIEHGMMPMSLDGVSTQMIPVDGSSSCTQILTLEKGVIQMFGANCVTVINFTPY